MAELRRSSTREINTNSAGSVGTVHRSSGHPLWTALVCAGLWCGASTLAAQDSGTSPLQAPPTITAPGEAPSREIAPEPLAEWVRADKKATELPRARGYATFEELLRSDMRQQNAALRKCYRAELREDPQQYGEVILNLTLAADGRISKAEVDFATLSGPAMEPCVLKVFQNLKMATPPREGYKVRYPLVFTSSKTPPEVIETLRRRYQLEPDQPPPEKASRKPEADKVPW